MRIKSQIVMITLTAFAIGCAGTSKPVEKPGPSHTRNDENVEEIDKGEANNAVETTTGTGVEVPEVEVLPVTFVLKNSGEESLFLNMDKGWYGVIYAYTGQIPNAKSIVMFPMHCTTSCDAPPEEVCPYCPVLTRAVDIRAAENHDEVLVGESREVGWDMKVFSYQSTKGVTKGKKSRCKCSSISDVPPAEYTIKACGLRKTQSAKNPSKYECVEGIITLPVTEDTKVVLDFTNTKKSK